MQSAFYADQQEKLLAPRVLQRGDHFKPWDNSHWGRLNNILLPVCKGHFAEFRSWNHLIGTGTQPIKLPASESLRMLSIRSKIAGILVGNQMERSASIPFNRNIRDHLWRCSRIFWSEYSNKDLLFHFDKPVHCSTSLHLCREFGKGKKRVIAIPLGWPGLIGKCCSIFLGHSHWSLSTRSGIMKTPWISWSPSNSHNHPK